MRGIDMKYGTLFRLVCCSSLLCAFSLSGCQTLYYTTMEKIGFQKRDIMVNRVENARNAQEEAKEQFSSALEKFSSVLNFQGGKIQEVYDDLSAELKRSESKAEAVHTRVADVEDVAEALFDEWEAELAQYNNERLRQASKRKLADTKRRYSKMIGVMKKAAASIDPVLAAFKDQVLFLKHNLNAKAVASIQGEVASVQTDIGHLIKEMEASIDEANKFIASLADETT